MKGEKCGSQNFPKKIFLRCFCWLCLSVFGVLSLTPSYVSAVSPTYYNARYSALAGAQWNYNLAQGYKFGFDYLYDYEWVIDQIPITGNTANIHFETNIVLQGSFYGLNSRFHNTDFLTVKYCGSSGQNVSLKSLSISSVQTDWVNSNLSDYKMRTLTVYADVVVSGFTNGTSDLYCGIGLSNNWAFAARTNSDYGPATAYFEQQPTRVQFTNDNSEAYQKQTIDAINNLNQTTQQGSKDIVDAINNQSENEKSEYQNQASENESDINSDTANNEAQATNLISVITSVFSVIKDTSAGSCNFTFPSNLYGGSPLTISLCPAGYTRFIDTEWNPVPGSGWLVSIRSAFSSVIMVVFLVGVVISILHALKKLYNMFLGGKD